MIISKTEEELWKEYKKTKDPRIRDVFVHKYAPLVKYVAGKIAGGMPKNIEFDDLVGYGTLGLLDAIEKFDPSKNIKFKTYAPTRIRGAIYDELRALDWIPRSVRQKAKNIENAIRKLENKLGRTATDEEIAEELDMTLVEFHRSLLDLKGIPLIYLDDAWFKDDNDENIAIIDTIESPKQLNPDEIVEKDEIHFLIANAIEDLPKKEKVILILYYYEDLTLKEIGEVLGVTESRVSQLHTKAIIRLRSKFEN